MRETPERPRPTASAGASPCGGGYGRPVPSRRLPAALTALLIAAALLASVSPASFGQSLGDAMKRTARGAPKDTTDARAPTPAWPVLAGEVVLGTALAAGAGYGMGLLAEVFCDACDAGEPGGDTPGLLTGVPLGAFAGVWLVGRVAPPSGRLGETLVGAAAGTAVFAAYGRIIENQSDLVRWAGVVLPAALAATAWNRSRYLVEPELSWHRPPPTGWGRADPAIELRLVALRF